MSGEELQVVPEDLAGKANQLRGLSWSSMTAQPALISPDALMISSVAITNLSVNAESLWDYQEFGRLEGLRLAQTLDNVAGAYARVDQTSGDDIGSTIGGSSGGASNGTVYPQGVDLPAPTQPPKMPIPKGQLASDQGVMYPPAVQTALDSGDDGASLRAAAAMWRANAQSLAASAEQFEVNSLNWEGEAADAAYGKFNAYRDWLISLAGSWNRLAGEADHIVAAHSRAKEEHRPIAEKYESFQQQVVQNPPGSPAFNDAMNQMARLQASSEDLRNGYARAAQPDQIQADDPPPPIVSGIPVTADEHRRARPYRPEDSGRQGPGGGQQSPGGGGGSAPAQPTPQEAPLSPMSAADQASQAAQQGASQGGQQGSGSPGGGQSGGQQGGGSPGGGTPSTGMPGTGKGDPKLPTDPNLRPAAAHGGGSSGAGGGGAGGGGVPSAPMQPAVGAETVAPTPVVAPVAPAAAAGSGAAAGGASGGGMGGMAPMHGAPGGGSGEKKRNPQLSQDEDLYTEERPWTEAVIGNRVRRRGTPDDTKKESQ